MLKQEGQVHGSIAVLPQIHARVDNLLACAYEMVLLDFVVKKTVEIILEKL